MKVLDIYERELEVDAARNAADRKTQMQVTETYKPLDRAAWRAWLEQYHATAHKIWLLLDDRPEEPTVAYLDAVEEAICFGWIDSIQKRFSANERSAVFAAQATQ